MTIVRHIGGRFRALKRAAEKIGDKLDQKSLEHSPLDSGGQKSENSFAIVLFMLSAMLVLLKV